MRRDLTRALVLAVEGGLSIAAAIAVTLAGGWS